MADETLKITITADNKSAIEGLKQVSTATQSFVTAQGKLVTGSNQAAQALTNVGRVAQDLPFGFIGIQNNLNPLLESFQRLKVETGSTKGALTALGSSLIGAGGIGLALSVASSAFLLFGDRLFDSKKKTEEARSEIDEYRRSLLEANKAASKNLETVANIVAAEGLQTTSLKDKQKIVEQLQNISEQYFGNLRIEKGEVVGLASAYQLYADNIFKVAEAKLASKKIEELGAKLADVTRLSRNLNDTFMQGGKQAFINPIESLKQLEKLTSGSYFESLQNVQSIVNLTGKTEKDVLQYLDQKNKLRTEELQLSGRIYGFALKTASVDNPIKNNTGKGPKEITSAPADISKQAKYTPRPEQDLVSVLDANRILIQAQNQSLDKLRAEQAKNTVAKSLMAGGLGGVIAPQKTQALAAYDQKEAENKQRLLGIEQSRLDVIANLNNKFKEQRELAETIGGAFQNLFQNIANGANPFETLSNAVKQLVVDLAAAAAKMFLIKAIMTAINPAAGAAKGAGGILGSLIGGITPFATGGIVSRPTLGMVGEAGTEAILPLDRFQGMLAQSFQMGSVSGNGGGTQTVVLDTVIRGNDLWLTQRRTDFNRGLKTGG